METWSETWLSKSTAEISIDRLEAKRISTCLVIINDKKREPALDCHATKIMVTIDASKGIVLLKDPFLCMHVKVDHISVSQDEEMVIISVNYHNVQIVNIRNYWSYMASSIWKHLDNSPVLVKR